LAWAWAALRSAKRRCVSSLAFASLAVVNRPAFSRSARVARIACQVLITTPKISAAATTLAAANAARFRRTSFCIR
jgi:hypothetical protein